MDIYGDCIPCLLMVRFRELQKLIQDEDKLLEASKKLLKRMYELIHIEKTTSTIKISTELFRLVKTVTQCSDPYRDEKILANTYAKQLYNKLRENIVRLSVENPQKAVFEALKISLLGNTLDFGVATYTPPRVDDIVKELSSMKIEGDVFEAIDMLLKAKHIVVVLDNCGEAVLDRLIADVLKTLGKNVVAIVKGSSFQNDITMNEVEDTGLKESFDLVISTNSDAASIVIEEISSDVIEAIKKSDVVLSKGMANYEYLSNPRVLEFFGRPIIFVLKAKCRPIARDLGVELGSYTVKVLKL